MFKLLLIFAVSMVFLCTVNGAKTPLQAAKKVASGETKKIEQKTCPVKGGVINPKLYYEYKNTRIYVCCPRCLDVVKKDPDKYLKKVQKQLKEIADAKKIVQKTCPVLGGVISPKLYYEYKRKIYVCCSGCINVVKKDPDKYLEKVLAEIAASKDKKQSTCPVMGGAVNPKLYYEYKRKIYVCCKDCIAVIKKDPDKYLKKVLAEIAASKDKKPSGN